MCTKQCVDPHMAIKQNQRRSFDTINAMKHHVKDFTIVILNVTTKFKS